MDLALGLGFQGLGFEGQRSRILGVRFLGLWGLETIGLACCPGSGSLENRTPSYSVLTLNPYDPHESYCRACSFERGQGLRH